MTKHQDTHTAYHGFSLIELVLIIVILSIVAGVAFPILKSVLPSYRLRTAARELFINFKKAKVQAITQHHPVLIQLSSDSYTICVDLDNDNICNNNDTTQTIYLPKSVHLNNWKFLDNATGNTTGFTSTGLVLTDTNSITHTGTVNISLTDGTRSYTLSLPYKNSKISLISGT